MDMTKVQAALTECGGLLRSALDGGSPMPAAKLNHCLDMIERARQFSPERVEKAMRWLGFIQGVLWTLGVADLEVLKRMNKPDTEPFEAGH